MSEPRLLYAEPAEVVKIARSKGWTDQKIITKLMFGRTYEERLAIAKVYAPVMGLKLSEFMIMAGLKKPPS
jgi:hypothetical protein